MKLNERDVEQYFCTYFFHFFYNAYVNKVSSDIEYCEIIDSMRFYCLLFLYKKTYKQRAIISDF